MLLTNQRNEKLAAARADFDARGMLTGTCLSDAILALQAAQELETDSATSESPIHSHATEEQPPDEDVPNDLDDNDPYQDPEDEDDELPQPGAEPLPSTEDEESDGVRTQSQIQQDTGVVNGPRVDGAVRLARKPRTYLTCY